MPLIKGLLNSTGIGNPSSCAEGLELNSGEQLECVVSVVPALLPALLGFKITATVWVLPIPAGAELIQASLPELRAKP